MKKAVITVLTTTVCAFAQEQPRVYWQAGDFNVFAAQPISGEAVKGAPYSAEAVTETTQTLADGNRIFTRQSSMQYRDGMGRERHEQTIMMKTPGTVGAAPQIVMISDPVANVSYSLNTRTHSAQKTRRLRLGNLGMPAPVTVRLAVGSGTLPLDPLDSGTEKTEDLGSQLVEGVPAKGTRTTHTIPAGQIGNQLPIQVVDENWYSPDLQIMVQTRHNDPRQGETLYKLTNIIRAEPDPSLFRVPPDYQINEVGPPGASKE
jgi:hypothetical protein